METRHPWTRWALLWLLAVLLASCAGTGPTLATETGAPEPVATVQAVSTVAASVSPTVKEVPPDLPTATLALPSPEATLSPLQPAAEPVRIRFAAGATSATVTGHVLGHSSVLYVLGAMEGQTMTLDLASPATDVLLEVWGADGTPLLRYVAGQTSWTGDLYATQDYFVKVVSFGSAVDYSLQVTIPPLVEPQPQRIQFAAGATSATVTGHVAANGAALYVLRAMAAQTMSVDLVSPASDVVLEIWGEDGTPLLRHVMGQTSWTDVLPLTQDYFVKVVSFGSAVDYSLQVTIPPPAEPEPLRIRFAPGGTSATVTGHVAANGAVVYVLGAMAGQTMSVDLISPASDVVLEIWGEDGTPLLRHVMGQTSWTDVLPLTQDYFIKVVSFGSAVNYSLQVTIPPPAADPEPIRIRFAPGGTSATVTGHVAANGAALYVLGAMAGQTMSVDLFSPASDVVLEIWGKDGTPLLRHVTGQTSWTGALPLTQDYFVKVVSFGSAVNYTLGVTIPPP